MRISDWSSDVCSSDLTTSATRCSFPPSYSYVCGSRGPGGECERGAPGQPSVRSIAVPARRASLNWTAGRHRFYQGNSCHKRMPLNANRTCPPQHPRADSWLSLDRCDSIRRRRRSEEHTSELQSLMRISYADFFFKKKN